MQQDSCILCAMLMIDLFISLLLPVLLLVAAEDCQSVVWNLLSCGSSWLHTRQRNPGVYCVYITTIGCTTSESVFSLSVGMIVLAINASVAWCLVDTVSGGESTCVIQEDISAGCRSAPGQTPGRVWQSSPARNAECRAGGHCLCSSCMHRARLDP